MSFLRRYSSLALRSSLRRPSSIRCSVPYLRGSRETTSEEQGGPPDCNGIPPWRDRHGNLFSVDSNEFQYTILPTVFACVLMGGIFLHGYLISTPNLIDGYCYEEIRLRREAREEALLRQNEEGSS